MKIQIIIAMCMLFAGSTASQSFENDTITTKNGHSLQIFLIKHASMMLTFDDQVIYIDPVGAHADYSKLPAADVILITHEHSDHLDPKAIAEVEKTGTLILANPAAMKKLGRGTALENGEQAQPTTWLHVEAVPAYNTSPDRKQFHPKGGGNGYVLTLGGTRIYLAGDTEDIPEMKNLKDIDIAFLPVNQPYTMTVTQAAHAARMVNPRVLYPYHYGETEIQALVTLLKSDPEIEVRVRQMQ